MKSFNYKIKNLDSLIGLTHIDSINSPRPLKINDAVLILNRLLIVDSIENATILLKYLSF